MKIEIPINHPAKAATLGYSIYPISFSKTCYRKPK
jgi:hypothetical protein